MVAYQLVNVEDGTLSELVSSVSMKECSALLGRLLSEQKLRSTDLVLVVLQSADGDENPDNISFSRAPLLRVETLVAMFNEPEVTDDV